jgi:hypothetical protein
LRAIDEELHRFRGQGVVQPYGGPFRELHRRYRELMLAGDSQRRAAGGQDLDCRRAGEEIGDERGRVDNVLEIVEHEEQTFGAEEGAQ